MRPLDEACEIAAFCYAALERVTTRLVVCGSIRRGAPVVKDVEIVAQPMLNGDLFGGETPLIEPIVRICWELGRVAKQGERYIQVADICGQTGFNLDLFLAHPPAQWGSIVAIRTGPWQLSRFAVAAMKRRGFQHVDGHVRDMKKGTVCATPTEREFFAYAGIPMVPPEERTELAHRLGAMQT